MTGDGFTPAADTIFGKAYITIRGENLTTHLDLVDRPLAPGQGGANIPSVARLYAMLSQGGELDGVRLVSPESVRTFGSVQLKLPDEASYDLGFLKPGADVPRMAWGLGFAVNEHENHAPESSFFFGPEPSAFGHYGAGGQLGFCDPVNRIGFGFVRSELEPGHGAAVKLIDALYESEAVRSPNGAKPISRTRP
jgi:CubicO group peptidase (beta-lactamase class C family)